MLKSDYASELTLAKMEIHRLRIENAEAHGRLSRTVQPIAGGSSNG